MERYGPDKTSSTCGWTLAAGLPEDRGE